MGNENSSALMYEIVLGPRSHLYAEIIDPSTIKMMIAGYRYKFKPIFGCCNFIVVI